MKRWSLRIVAGSTAVLTAVAVASAVAVTPAVSAPAFVTVAAPIGFSSAFDQISSDFAALFGTNASFASDQQTLHADLSAISANVLGNKLCPAVTLVTQVEALLKVVGALGVSVDTLLADAFSLLASLLGDPRTVLCGGAQVAPSPGGDPVTAVGENDTTAVVLHVLFPVPTFNSVTDVGTKFVAMHEPGMQIGTAQGEPALPSTGLTVAVPLGASLSTTVLSTSGYDIVGVNLEPVQPPQPIGSSGAPQHIDYPLAQDAHTYALRTPYPSPVVATGAVGSMRDLRVANVAPIAATYTPAVKVVHVMTEMDLKVVFSTNTGIFGSSLINSPWESSARADYQHELINAPALLPGRLATSVPQQECGEEMVVVTGPDDLATADRFATARTSAGILTKVVNDTIFPTSNPVNQSEQIRQYLIDQVNDTACIRPDYVLLMGSEQEVPAWAVNTGLVDPAVPEQPVVTDAPYGYLHHDMSDNLNGGYQLAVQDHPDLHVGRIPGSAGEVAEAVQKIVGYESTPPTLAGFYNDASAFTYYQTCPDPGCPLDAKGKPETSDPSHESRNFVSETEDFDTIVGAASKSIVAQAFLDPQVQPSQVGSDSNGQRVSPSITFSHDPDVNGQFNAGRFLVYQAAHGYDDGTGWAEPKFSTSQATVNQVAGLTNYGLFPVLWNLGCNLGDFDLNPDGFATQMLGDEPTFGGVPEPDLAGGAVAVVTNTNLGWGAFDGATSTLIRVVFPDQQNQLDQAVAKRSGVWVTLADTPITSVLRIGDSLDEAKWDGLIAPYGSNAPFPVYAGVPTVEAFGDPTMDLWRDVPQRFNLSPSGLTFTRTDAAHVEVTLLNQPAANGATVTATDPAGDYISRATLTNGTAILSEPATMKSTDPVGLIFAKDGWISASPAVPNLTSILPTSSAVGTAITLTGSNFSNATEVRFGSTIASFIVKSDTTIMATVPPGAGVTSVVVLNQFGSSAPAAFTYPPAVTSVSPNRGSPGGGSTVTITGHGFHAVAPNTETVYFGETPATQMMVVDDSHITAAAPPGTGQVHITVTVDSRTSASTSADLYTYAGATLTSVTPNQLDWTTVPHPLPTIDIRGTGFTGSTGVDIVAADGTMHSAKVLVISDTEITAQVPDPVAAGLWNQDFQFTAHVVVRNPLGDSTPTAADQITYDGATLN